MKYLVCENSKEDSKYFKGRRCYAEVEVDNDAKAVLCWKCTLLLLPAPETKTPTGYPRGWKFMTEFVDKDGNVYHKGVLQEELFNTLPPTEIKESTKERKKKVTIDDRITDEFSKLVQDKKKKVVAKKATKKSTKKSRRK